MVIRAGNPLQWHVSRCFMYLAARIFRGRPDSGIKLCTFMADGIGSLGAGRLRIVSDIGASRNRSLIALYDHSGQGTFRKL